MSTTVIVTGLLFSGRPDPSWTLSEDEAALSLREIARNPGIVVPLNRVEGRLGYSGLRIDLSSELLATELGLPGQFCIHTGETRYEDKAQEIAGRLVDVMFSGMVKWDSMVPGLGPDAVLQRIVQEEVASAVPRIQPGLGEASVAVGDLRTADAHPAHEMPAEGRGCIVDSTAYNPDFWNDCYTIERNNNCYCYATNRRIDKFGWPGKGGGVPIRTPFTVENVAAGIIVDGGRHHGDCLPTSEKPRWFIALVIAPYRPGDPNYNDFHFYRHSAKGGFTQQFFWSHKRGQLKVTNVDLSGNIITNVEQADRGKYTEFGGYFYAPKSMCINGYPVASMEIADRAA